MCSRSTHGHHSKASMRTTCHIILVQIDCFNCMVMDCCRAHSCTSWPWNAYKLHMCLLGIWWILGFSLVLAGGNTKKDKCGSWQVIVIGVCVCWLSWSEQWNEVRWLSDGAWVSRKTLMPKFHLFLWVAANGRKWMDEKKEKDVCMS